ncbi:ABC transporter ATP-binding protein [Halobacillus sp. KGW1]|uniref:ABC transporter ATP-binding protein n=1 Tax=Halobacillus sp. KGW1 TaxID=1793726 RepID=UPI000782BFAF|nr:ABC transporter ATP-binding protein [Halobacillus sp. KGW1]
MTSPALEIQRITKQFKGPVVLSELSFTMEKGQILSVVGPSGSGKTTLLRVLAGLEKPTSGTILMNGQDITRQKANQRDISLVFQQPLLFPHMTVEENITYGAKVSKKYTPEKIKQLLAAIGMTDYRSHFPSQISGGQQQRTALARAMATEPEVILFDEPFSSLDPHLRQDLRYWVRDFLVKRNTTALFVTHDLEEAMIMGDRIALFQDGAFQQIGDADTLHDYPANIHVASFMGGHFIIDDRTYVPLKHVRFHSSEKEEDSLTFQGRVEHITYNHGHPIAHIELPELEKKLAIPLQDRSLIETDVLLYVNKADVRTFQAGIQ